MVNCENGLWLFRLLNLKKNQNNENNTCLEKKKSHRMQGSIDFLIFSLGREVEVKIRGNSSAVFTPF